MKRCFPLLTAHIIFSFFAFAVYSAEIAEYKIIAPILESAERFFVSVKSSDYEQVWNLLTEKSRSVIINDVYKASKKMNINTRKENVAQDFHNGGVMFRNYWSSFERTFDTDMILEQSRWEMGTIGNKEVELIITHRKSRRPTRLIMRKEQNSWKVGLVETFWSRKTARFLKFIFQ